jgi:hypothetical protein
MVNEFSITGGLEIIQVAEAVARCSVWISSFTR